MKLATSSRTGRIRDGGQAVILGNKATRLTITHIEKDGLKLASTLIVSNDILQALKQDLDAHDSGATSTSGYNFAGKDANKNDIGMSRKAQLALNRAGQVLQFLAGYYQETTDSAKQYEIAYTAARVYGIFRYQNVFMNDSEFVSGYSNGMFAGDPSGPLMLVGLMAIDKQGVTEDAGWTAAKNANIVPSYTVVRNTMIKRMHDKVTQALKNTYGDPDGIPDVMLRDSNIVFHNQVVAPVAVNGVAMCAAAANLARTFYGITPDKSDNITSGSRTMFRLLKQTSGSVYDHSGNKVDPRYQDVTGHNLSLSVGNTTHSRGPFPSIGYNSLVGFAMILQAMAEAGSTASTFRMLNSFGVINHELRTDALMLNNYYRTRLSADGRLYELGAHNNMGGSAERMRDFGAEWNYNINEAKRRGTGYWSTLSEDAKQAFRIEKGYVDDGVQRSDFYDLSRQDSDTAFKGQAGYAYSLMWVMPNHSLFTTHLPNNYGRYDNKQSWEISYAHPHASRSLAQAFATTSESAMARVLSGVGAALFHHQSTIA